MKYFSKGIEFVLSPILGRRLFQGLFERMYGLSLIGMNIGMGAFTENSGEGQVIKYVGRKVNSTNKILVFDVGANVGKYSRLVTDILGERALIRAFEPSPETCNILKKNLHDLKNIVFENIGFGDENGTAILFCHGEGSPLASVYDRDIYADGEVVNKTEVIFKTLDQYCQDNAIEHIDFLKLDVEGHELSVLEGANNMLNSGSIDYIQFEFGSVNIESRTFFFDFFNKLSDNYHLYRIVRDGLYPISSYRTTNERFNASNYLAERKAIR